MVHFRTKMITDMMNEYMDGRIDGMERRTEEWTDGNGWMEWTGERRNGRMNGWEKWSGERRNGRMNGWVEWSGERRNGRMEWMDGMERRTDEWTDGIDV